MRLIFDALVLIKTSMPARHQCPSIEGIQIFMQRQKSIAGLCARHSFSWTALKQVQRVPFAVDNTIKSYLDVRPMYKL